MFGMIFGALVCRKAGISIATFSVLLPKTFSLISDYHSYFAERTAQGLERSKAPVQTYFAGA